MAKRKSLHSQIAEIALSKKANNVVVLDLRKLTSMTDYFVVCSGDSETHVKAIAEAILSDMEAVGERAWHSEGQHNLQWVILDYVDVVVHVFHKDARQFYGLEKLWGDARIQRVEDARTQVAAAVRSAPVKNRRDQITKAAKSKKRKAGRAEE